MSRHFKKIRVSVISDFLSTEIFGPSILAQKDFEVLNTNHRYECYLVSSSRMNLQGNGRNQRIIRRSVVSDVFLFRFQSIRKLSTILSAIVRLVYGVRLTFVLLKLKPRIVVVHKIGFIFPIHVLLIMKLFFKNIIIVHHDFMFIHKGKVYPANLKISPLSLNDYDTFLSENHFQLIHGPRKDLILVRNLTRKFLNVTYNQFQKNLLINNGVSVDFVTRQTIEECRHDQFKYQSRQIDNRIRILFIGRSVGKGLDKAFEILLANDIFSLTIISELYTQELIPPELRESRVKFLGPKSQEEVFQEIHNSQVVFARSNCLEVGPLTVLEALSHGTPVICSPFSGNSEIAYQVDPNLISFEDDLDISHRIIELVDSWDSKLMKRRFWNVYASQPSVSMNYFVDSICINSKK